MYQPFQDATYLPTDLQTATFNHENGKEPIPEISMSAAKATDGSIVVALANVMVDKKQEVAISLDGAQKLAGVSGEILTADKTSDFNDFNHPNTIASTAFKGAKLKGNKLTVQMPAKSIVVLKLK